MLVVLKEGFPCNNKLPPVEADHQSTVAPDGGVAPIVTTPGPQRDPLKATGAAGTEKTDAVTGALAERQVPNLDST
jgi:hypothetical protein